MRPVVALVLACCFASCASPPPKPVVAPPPPPPTFDQKTSWILRLEDERVLRDAANPMADLVGLLADDAARVRRRAALAIGRVGLREGVQPLVALLSADGDPEVRQMAAFGLGLLGDKTARDPLVTALNDPVPLVQGSAAEALGLLGDANAADPIARMAIRAVDGGAFATPPVDGDDVRRDRPASAYRLALFALVRLKAYPALASAALDPAGQPRVHWWPVAYALQRIEDARAYPALVTLAGDPHPYTRAFAVKGLGALKNRQAVPLLLPMIAGGDRSVAVEAIRALGKIGDPTAGPALLKLVQQPKPDATLRLEAIAALGTVKGDGVFEALVDVIGDPNPFVRAATLASLPQIDRESFVTILSALDPDPDWRVRRAMATVLGTLTPEVGLPRLRAMLSDSDQRVGVEVLASIGKLAPPDAAGIMIERLKADDPMIRASAAAALGDLKPPNGATVLAAAYRTGLGDQEYSARAAALDALAKYGSQAAMPVLTEAFGDKDWAVRVKAASLARELDPSSDAGSRIRPAPAAHPADYYGNTLLVTPPYSTEMYLDTDHGTVQIELAVLDAPLAVDAFVTLARKNFFDGLSFHRVVPDFVAQGGDPRGDGEGGPGFTLRDELSQRSYVRGVVGIALDWADTGGSQFFITLSPQPHLDAKYTVIGRVISGMEIVDQIQQGDVIRRVRVWDGQEQR